MTETVAESRALTGLRGLAALLVMLHHFYLHLALGEHLPAQLHGLLRKGYLGVDLFFVLSGFVLCLVYRHWFDGTRPFGMRSWLVFMARRLARIWPLHAVVVLIVFLPWHGPLPGTPFISARTLAANLLMVQAWGVSASINPPSWSVSTEFAAYLLFPAAAALGLRSRPGAAACLLLAAALLAFGQAMAPPLGEGRRGPLDLYANYSVLPLLRCLAGVLSGIVAWRLGESARVRHLVSRPGFALAALLLVPALMLGRVNDLLILPVLPALVLGLHFGNGPATRLLGGPVLHRLGLLSFAIYLLHYTVLDLFPFRLLPLPLGLVLFCALTLLLAAAFRACVEEPGRRLVRRAAEKLLRQRAGGTT